MLARASDSQSLGMQRTADAPDLHLPQLDWLNEVRNDSGPASTAFPDDFGVEGKLLRSVPLWVQRVGFSCFDP